MKKLLSVIVAASLLLYPFATFAQDYGSQTVETQQVPPVAQTLVREGDFAIKLVATLGLGSTTDEALAEDALAKVGVAPANGWLSDYPMTPQIIGQLQDSIVAAASDGNLNMTAEQAASGFNSLISQMNLPAPAGPEQTAPESSNALSGQPNQTEINNYYYDQGPPVITYYPPPPYYGYLYDWVPYPVFWFGFWFPGFYICHNFTTVVVFDHRPCIVSNHVIDPRTGRVAVVDPVTRTRTGSVRSGTTLRTQSGRTFSNLADLRNGVSPTGPAGRTGTFANSTFRSGGFKSAEARRSAGVIYSRMSERTRFSLTGRGSGAGGERQFIAPNVPRRSYQGPVRGGERRFIAPSGPGRSYRSSLVQQRTEAVRSFYAPRTSSMSGMRQFGGSNAPSRSLGGSVTRGGHSSAGSLPRGGYGR